MTLSTAPHAPPRRRAWRNALPSRQRLPLLVTLLVCAGLYVAACVRYDHFFSLQVVSDLLSGNAFLGIAAIGETFVILAGGIDLSIGSAVGCTSVFVASQVQLHHWPPALAIATVLVGGTVVGSLQGLLIAAFDLQPFLVTLGGLFLYHGLALLISSEAINITHPAYVWMSEYALPVGYNTFVPLTALLFLVVLVVATFFLACRPAGRAVYALGGNEQSALLMGLPVARVKVLVYAVSGFAAALAGVTATVMTGSGNALTGGGLELDAIAAVVIGGTVLTGGIGGTFGTLLGVLIFGIIQTSISFEGDLSTWWARIVIGLLLLAFIVLQTLLQPKESHS